MFKLTNQAINPASISKQIQDPAAGALVSFEGIVRNHHLGKEVLSLEYEAYPTLAEKEGNRILNEILDQYEIMAASCTHRLGHLEIGDIAVCIYVSSVHRAPAFEACRTLIDMIKISVPIWKKEHYADGTSSWTMCQNCSSHA